MRITYTEVNGRTYAYTCTSKRVPGRINPVSKREYLGVVDPYTGRILPKRGSGAPYPDIGAVKDHGGVAIALHLAEELGIREDLQCVFGDEGDRIMALVLAQTIRPSSSNDVVHTLDTSSVCESIGLDPRTMNNQDIRRLMNSISLESMNEFFKHRLERNPGKVLVFNHPMTSTNESDNILRSIPDVASRDDLCVTLFVTEHGNPIGLRAVRNPEEDVSDLLNLMEHLGRVVEDCVFVSDSRLSTTLCISELIKNKVEFMIPYPISSEQYASVIRDYMDLDDERYSVDGPFGIVSVKEGTVGISMVSDSSVVVPESDHRFNLCKAHLRSYVSIDPTAKEDAVHAVNGIIHSVRTRMNGRASSDPQALLRSIAGSTHPLFKVSIDGNGLMKVTVRKEMMGDFRDNAGKTLILATSASWEEVMKARAIRRSIKDVMWQYHRGSNWVYKHVGKGVSMQSQMFVEFLVFIIYSRMREVLINNGLKADITETLHIASSVKLLSIYSEHRVGQVDRKAKRILDMFGVDLG